MNRSWRWRRLRSVMSRMTITPPHSPLAAWPDASNQRRSPVVGVRAGERHRERLAARRARLRPLVRREARGPPGPPARAATPRRTARHTPGWSPPSGRRVSTTSTASLMPSRMRVSRSRSSSLVCRWAASDARGLGQLAASRLEVVVRRVELLDGRLELLVERLELLVRGLELLVEGLDLLGRRLDLLVGDRAAPRSRCAGWRSRSSSPRWPGGARDCCARSAPSGPRAGRCPPGCARA